MGETSTTGDPRLTQLGMKAQIPAPAPELLEREGFIWIHGQDDEGVFWWGGYHEQLTGATIPFEGAVEVQ